jgi:hypothetical protein
VAFVAQLLPPWKFTSWAPPGGDPPTKFRAVRALLVSIFAATAACGGSVTGDDPILYDDAGNPITDTASLIDTGRDTKADTTSRDTAVRDTWVEPDTFIDPMCPDAPPPKTDYKCDPLKPPPGDCKSGQACYPWVEYPTDPCEHETYHAGCFPAGSGKQGDPCGSSSCASGFACVASGAGNVCVQMCKPGTPGVCPEGLVCQTTDVPGIGGCL